MANRKKMTDEEMLALVKECAEKLGRSPSLNEVTMMTEFRLTKWKLARRFSNYGAVLKMCGLQPVAANIPTPRAELFLSWARVARQLGALPTMTQYEALSGRSSRPVGRRVKGWRLVPQLMMKIMQEQNLAAEWEDVAEMMRRQEVRAAELNASHENGGRRKLMAGAICSSRSGAAPVDERTGAPGTAAVYSALLEPPELEPGQPVYGEPIGHPAMAFAPVNEASLAILFGAMAVQLGFIILRAQQPCPDVEAMRKMNGGWQLQKIELEIESINFLRHMHDRRDVDLIVCWKHNWKDCPVPVLELGRLFKIGGSGDREIG